MATSGTYYLDAASLALATAVYSDAGLLTLAPDGFYSDNSIVREQLLGVLQTQADCPGCGTMVTLCYSDIDVADACCNCTILL
jgi:hypothetical protein